MPAQFNSILLRASLKDEGTLPRTGDVSNSPDVIPFGTEPAQNPVVLFIGNYNRNVGKPLKAGEFNYIYIRGKSLVEELVEADLYLYFAEDSTINDPSKWSKNLLKTADGENFAPVIAQAEGNIVVSGAPFVWVPPTPGKKTSYSLIGIAVESGTTPDFSGITDWEEYVDNNVNVGWNKVVIQNPTPPPVPPLRWDTSFNYTQGIDQPEMQFDVICKNIPAGSYISFTSETKGGTEPSPKIMLNQTKVTDPNGIFGVQSSVKADYKGVITFSLFAVEMPPGSSLTFRASYLQDPSSKGASKAGPSKSIVLASVTTTNKTGLETKGATQRRPLMAEHHS